MKVLDKRKDYMEEVYQDDINAYIGFKYSHLGYWHSDNRDDFHRAQEDQLIKLLDPLNIQAGERVLDIGGGQGGTAIWIAKRYDCEVVLVDIVENMVQKAREVVKDEKLGNSIETICSDFLKLKVPEGSFDHIVSVEALHHISDKKGLFNKVFSLLKPGGKFSASIYLSDMKPGFLKKLYLKLTVGDDYLSPINHYMDSIKNSGLEECAVEDISDAVLPKSSQLFLQEPYYSRIVEYHKKYYGRFSVWLLPLFDKWHRSILRKKQLRLVICRTQKSV